MEANVSLGELQQKIKRLEGLCQVRIISFLLLFIKKAIYLFTRLLKLHVTVARLSKSLHRSYLR